MEIIPIKTRVLQPPQDDLLAVIKESLTDLQKGDVVCVSSKVVAIHEGRCQKLTPESKRALIEKEADFIIKRDYWGTDLTAINSVLVSSIGIDQSNGDGYHVLLPRDPFASAATLYEFIKAEYGISDVGVVVIDSRSHPLRFGATGVAIGWWGIEPLQNHKGRTDLFGREIMRERSNIVDGIAAAATVVMGEVDECRPLTIVRNIPRLTFTPENTKDELFCPPEDDTFRVLYQEKV